MPIVPVSDARKHFNKTFCFGIKGQPLQWLGVRQAGKPPGCQQPGASKSSFGNCGGTDISASLYPISLLATCALGEGAGHGCGSLRKGQRETPH